MKFVDEVIIEVKSGKGGKGAVSFRRAKYQPKMGPDGGDGGRGGSVYFEASHDVQSLLDFRFQSMYAAENGHPGERNDCNGRAGKDLSIKVPVGTVIRDSDSKIVLADLVEPGVPVLLLPGGRGGLGNMNFATPTRQAPDFSQPGEPGHERKIELELRLLADVALVGFPNAGKSTLISRLSAAKPKIADYPFTTLVPNLGVVKGKSVDFVIADIPGLIEGASEGKGLGVRFLKHVERCRALLFVLDLDPHNERDLLNQYQILKRELQNFSFEISQRPTRLVINKIDLMGGDAQDEVFGLHLKEKMYPELLKELKKDGALDPILISAVSGAGLDKIQNDLESLLLKLGPRVFKNEVSSEMVWGDEKLLLSEESSFDERE